MTSRKKARTLLLVVCLLVLASAGGYAVYMLGMHRGMGMSAGSAAPSVATGPGGVPAPGVAPANPPAQGRPLSIPEGEDATRRHISAGLKAGDVDPANGQTILHYHDPMVPGNKFDKPAKSPFMDMMLVPVYAGGGTDTGTISVSPRVQQNLGVRTAVATEGLLPTSLSAVGSIAFNERDQATLQARATGFVERLHVRATLDSVRQGQPLLDLYVPDWVAAQEEFLAVRRMQGPDLAGMVDAARQRMRLAGMSQAQIAAVESSGRPSARLTLYAPIAGVVTELAVREGMAVAPGATLVRINGLSSVWANAEVPESQAALLRPGAPVVATTPAVPGEVFKGKVQAILPEVSTGTRTLKARLELANPGARLVPGMFVTMQFQDPGSARMVLVPTEAVIHTGTRAVVLLAEPEGKFRPVEVQTGRENAGQTAITQGLTAGQRVVVSSQFLIDSEASLKGVEARLNAAPAGSASAGPTSPAADAPRHQGEARVDAVEGNTVTLTHGPIPSLKWGAMTMDFKAPPQGLPRNVQSGDQVTFEFAMDAEGLPQLTGISPQAPAASSAPAAAPAPTTGRKP